MVGTLQTRAYAFREQWRSGAGERGREHVGSGGGWAAGRTPPLLLSSSEVSSGPRRTFSSQGHGRVNRDVELSPLSVQPGTPSIA